MRKPVLDKAWESGLIDARNQIEVIIASVFLRGLGMHGQHPLECQLRPDDPVQSLSFSESTALRLEVSGQPFHCSRSVEVACGQQVFLGSDRIPDQQETLARQ